MSKTLSFHNDCYLKNRCAKYDTCPMILVHRILSGKWKILILWYLSNGTLRSVSYTHLDVYKRQN